MSEVVIALSILFIAGGASVLIANRFGFAVVPALIVAGLAAGQFLEQEALIELAIWGVAFLVFVFGIRVDISDVQLVLRDAESAAMTQLVVVTPVAFAIGFLASMQFGFDDPGRNAVYFAAAAALSSTLVGASRLRGEEIRENLIHGRLASTIHFFDDLVAIGLVLILTVPSLTDVDAVMAQLGYGMVLMIAGLLVYRHGYPLLIRVADGESELILMGSISILIAFIAAAEVMGISLVVGAFSAGLAIRKEGTETLSVRNGIESIRDFFVAIFFVTMGALVTFPSFETLVLAGGLIVLTMVLNPLVQVVAFSIEGYDPRTSFLASFSLNQVSELAIVIAIQALVLETIAPELFEAIILAAAATMIAASATQRHEEWLYKRLASRLVERRRWRQLEAHSNVADGLEDHIVILGYGRHGRRLTHALDEMETPYVVIENDPLQWDDLTRSCENYVFGDAAGEYPQQMAEIDRASLVISTVNHRPLSEALLESDFDADLIVRADTSVEAAELLDAGAAYVIVPNLLASGQLTTTITEALEDVRNLASLQRDHLRHLDRLERAGLTSRRD